MKIDESELKKSLDKAIELSVRKKKGFPDKVRKFDESIDFILNLKNLNLNDPKQRIDKELVLPNEIITEDKPNVCVIATDEVLLKAKKLGVDTLDKDQLEALNRKEKKEKKKFVKKYDYFIVEAKLMPLIARYLARFLGPLGKMPKPFPAGYGILTNPNELENIIDRYKKIIRIQVKKQPVLQVKVGKKSMDKNKILENIKAVINFVADQMPHKYNNFRSIYIKTTMGKPVKIGG
ncbi:MAG: 50S ribosomal protein L1 [Promethearchaeia archaeon]